MKGVESESVRAAWIPISSQPERELYSMTSTKKCSVAAANSESSQKNRVSDCPLRMAFHQTSHPDLTRVTCELHEGLAILHGKVSTFYLK
jgi:hypothetical protein